MPVKTEAEWKVFNDEVKANHAAILAKMPRGAHALIVAELDEDDCDYVTDYHNHKTKRVVAIGWRMTKRESFKALRKAAASFEPTAHLGPGKDVWFALKPTDDGFRVYVDKDGEPAAYGRPRAEFPTKAEAELFAANIPGAEVGFESVEHRENYSMGAGNYLKAGHDDADGWRVESRELKYSSPLPHAVIEDHLPEGGV